MTSRVTHQDSTQNAVKIAAVRALLGLKSETTRTNLGFAWWLIEPLIFLSIYYFIFGHLLKIEMDDFATFLVIGVAFWTWFNKSTLNCLDSIYEKKHILEHVRINPVIFPLTSIFKDSLKEGLILLLLLFFLLWNDYGINWNWGYLPLLLSMQLILTTGVGILVAGIIPFLSDMKIIISTGLQFMMFMSGVFYDKSNIPGGFGFLLDINPIAVLIEMFRDVLMYNQTPTLSNLYFVGGSGLFILIVALVFISANRNSYATALAK